MQLDRPFLAITPTVDGDVLAALARVDTSLSITQLRRVIGRYSAEGVRRSLARLVDQGIVRPFEVGNAIAYGLDREHLLADAVVAIANAKSRLLRQIEDSLESWPQEVRYAAIFGSAARGEMRPDSDIDLFVVHDDDVAYPAWESYANELTRLVFRRTGNWLSVMSMPQSELKRRWQSHDDVIDDVHGNGLTVRGTRGWLDSELRKAGSRKNA